MGQGRLSRSALRAGLRGRVTERALLDELRADIRNGTSRSLVLRGEAGIGKTALLEYLARPASDLTVLRAVGVDSEMELAYASLHQLCLPLLVELEKLPAPQQEALRVVFGLSTGPAPDRFLVGLAVLGLLSSVAEERPLLCLVDDAQWLDEASALTLVFVARRLLAIGLEWIGAALFEPLVHVVVVELLAPQHTRKCLTHDVRLIGVQRTRDDGVVKQVGFLVPER